MLERLFALENFGVKLGLENITRLCAALGHPERTFTSLHIAGTNGKGSVTAMVQAALTAAGIRAARYTSPHLAHLAERFVIGDRPVDQAALEALADEVLDRVDRLRRDGVLSVAPTFFEVTTAIGFELFRRERVQVAVIEVGLGGRFDATNVITPVAGAITTIGLDHQQYLGDTLAAIAFEKAGIIKPGMTLVAGALPPEAMFVVRHATEARGATLVEAADGVQVESRMEDGRARVTITTPRATYGPMLLALRGEHQVMNAVVAVRVLEAAAEHGVRVGRVAIEEGLSRVEWPARLEIIQVEGGRRVLLDAAHNPEGAQALASYLRRWHPELPPLVLGVSTDKDVGGILEALLPVVSTVFATAAPSPRALPPDDLAERVRAFGAREIVVEPDGARAVQLALGTSDMVCVAGSIFLAGAVRDGLRPRAILR